VNKSIWQVLVIPLLIFNIFSCSTSEVNHEIFGSESHHIIPLSQRQYYAMMFDNMNGYFKHDRSASVNGVTINTFIPQTESANRWHERIEIIHCKVESSMTVDRYYHQVIEANLADMCYYSTPRSRILQQTSNDIVYEYQVLNCGKKPNQVVIGRIIHTSRNIYIISYTVKTEHLDEGQRLNMIEIVESARLV
jgi:hypothetical protein